MKRIKETFKKNGFDYKLLEREGDIVLYEQKYEDTVVGYEVMLVRSHNGLKIHGKDIPASEYLPTTEEFGTRGWTFYTIGRAHEKVRLLKESV